MCLHGSHRALQSITDACTLSKSKCIPCFCRSVVTPSCSCAQITEACSRVISIHLCVVQCVWWGWKQRGRRGARFGEGEKKIQSFPVSFLGYFPRFHKQVLRSGKQHIEREMVGRRRKLDEKKRGVCGVIIQPPPKKREPVFLLYLPSSTFIISTNAALVWNWSRSWWRCRGFVWWWAKLLLNICLECVLFHRLSSPFLWLVSATPLALEKKIAIDGATLVAIIPHGRAKKSPIWKPLLSFFPLCIQIVPTPLRSRAVGLAADASCQ